MGWLAPGPGRFTPGKETRYPLYRRLGGPQGGSGRLWKISPPPGFDSRTVQPVASRYTDCAIPAPSVRGHTETTYKTVLTLGETVKMTVTFLVMIIIAGWILNTFHIKSFVQKCYKERMSERCVLRYANAYLHLSSWLPFTTHRNFLVTPLKTSGNLFYRI
jgi:hypothetical protein